VKTDPRRHPQSIPSPQKKLKGGIQIASLNLRGAGTTSTREKWLQINELLKETSIGILAVLGTRLTYEHKENINNLFNRQLLIHNSPDPNNTQAMGVGFVLNKKSAKWQEAKMIEVVQGQATLFSLQYGKGQSHYIYLQSMLPTPQKKMQTSGNNYTHYGQGESSQR